MIVRKTAAVTTTIALGLIGLGVMLLSSLIGWVDSARIYSLVLPSVVTASGMVIARSSDEQLRTRLAYGLSGIGVVMLLVRFDVIHGDLINMLLGIVCVVVGTSLFAWRNQSSARPKTQNT